MLVLHSAIMSNTKELATYREQHANPFGGNTASQTAYKRAERLSVAAHLITNFIPEHEPVRTQIRGKSLTLLENVLELREGFRTVGPERVNLVIAELLELTTLFEIAKHRVSDTCIIPTVADALKHAVETAGAGDAEVKFRLPPFSDTVANFCQKRRHGILASLVVDPRE